ncbi:MAG: PspC domain-containing protein [Chloroflexota bacterium]
MNGTSRLYRSTSEAMLGGVAAGLGNYFKIDPTIVRAAFVVLTFFTGGFFLIAYLAMWLLIPTAGSTATQPSEVVHENLNDMGARVRSFTGTSSTPANGGNGNANGGNGNGNATGGNGTNIVPSQAGAPTRLGAGPMVLIVVGAFFLLANFGFFRMIHWGFWWPLLLIGLGVLVLSRRENR